MRICLVSYEFPPKGGGEATYVRDLALGLGRSGHDVTILAPHEDKPWDKAEPFEVVRVDGGVPPVRMRGFLAGAKRKISALSEARKIDLVHVAFDYPTWPFRNNTALPWVATVHHLHKVEAASMAKYEKSYLGRSARRLKSSALTYLEGRLARSCTQVVAVSEFTAQSVRDLLSVPAERITVVKNGIDAGKFARGDASRFRRAFHVGKSMVLFVGRLERSKDLENLIMAFARTKGTVPEAELVVVGGGKEEYVRSLKGLADKEKVADCVLFTGRIPEETLIDAYAACSVVALPSLMEGFGISLLEGMASGRPCVATRVGAVPEVVSPESGLLVDPGDTVALANALSRVLSDKGEAEAMGAAGKRLASERYSTESMAEETAKVYAKSMVRDLPKSKTKRP